MSVAKLIVISAFAVALTGLVPGPAYANDSDSDLTLCVGTGGFDTSGTWQFFGPLQLDGPLHPPVGIDLCGVTLSSDAFIQVPVPSPSSFSVPPTAPPPPTVDPTCPICTAFSVLDTACAPEPEACAFPLAALFGLGSAPVSTTGMNLSGTGTFSCGNGTLSGTGIISPNFLGDPSYSLAWSASFSNGVGAVTGTATADCFGEGGIECGQVKTLAGHLFVIDGSPIPGGCNDSVNSSLVGAALTLNP